MTVPAITFAYAATDPFANRGNGSTGWSLAAAGSPSTGGLAVAGGQATTILPVIATSIDGSNWSLTSVNPFSPLQAASTIVATDGTNIVAGAELPSSPASSNLFYSPNQGSSWFTATNQLFVGNSPGCALYANGKFWFGVGGFSGHSGLWYSTDGGNHWSVPSPDPFPSQGICEAIAADGLLMAAVGYPSTTSGYGKNIIAYSADGGTTWAQTATRPQPINTLYQIQGVCVFNGRILVLVEPPVTSDPGIAYYSDDHGTTWTASTLPAAIANQAIPLAVFKTASASSSVVLAATTSGVIVSGNGGGAWALNGSQPLDGQELFAFGTFGDLCLVTGATIDTVKLHTLAAAAVVLSTPPTRQWPREDALALGGRRQAGTAGNLPTSAQSSIRQAPKVYT